MTMPNTVFIFTISDIVQVTFLAIIVLYIAYLYISDLFERKFKGRKGRKR
jgi:hypothetical protein